MFMNIAYTIALVLIVLSSSASAAAENYSIANAEQVIFTKNTLDDAESNIKTISFTSFKRNFNLILKEKNQIIDGFSSKENNIKLYAGKIQSNEKSWVRITVIDDKYTGAIFDGTELYMLDIGNNIQAALTNKTDMRDAKTVIYKSSELSSNFSCGIHGSHESTFSYQNLLPESTRNQFNPRSKSLGSNAAVSARFAVAASTATQQINLRIVTDAEYAASSNLDAEAQVISQMNIVDGIFSEQVGVQFNITSIEVLTNNGSLNSTSPSTLLTQFRNFVGNNNPGLAHLFTGRNLDGNVIGIANLRAICRISGSGLTQAGGRGTAGALTAAHEFGHNFGAPHDNQTGSACAASPGTFLMNPSLNGSDQFSPCSLEQIATIVENAQCLVPVDNTPPEPTPTPTPIEPATSCNFSIDFANGTNNFAFIADSQTPLYSSSAVSGGSINTFIGGVDDNDIANIEGVWSRQCLSDDNTNLRFNIQASLAQSSEYETNEFSQIALRVNGTTTVLDTLTGDGNGGASPSTGIQKYNVNIALNSGINTVELVCFNNLKTFENETTECRFGNLETSEIRDLDGADEPDTSKQELCVPIAAQDSGFAVVCL